MQTRIEERLEVFDQEMIGTKRELSKIPVIKPSQSEITKNLELMRLQSEKQKQMFMETMVKGEVNGE